MSFLLGFPLVWINSSVLFFLHHDPSEELLLLLSYVRLFWDPMDCSPPSSSVDGISQSRILKWVDISISRDLPGPGIEPALRAL